MLRVTSSELVDSAPLLIATVPTVGEVVSPAFVPLISNVPLARRFVPIAAKALYKAPVDVDGQPAGITWVKVLVTGPAAIATVLSAHMYFPSVVPSFQTST